MMPSAAAPRSRFTSDAAVQRFVKETRPPGEGSTCSLRCERSQGRRCRLATLDCCVDGGDDGGDQGGDADVFVAVIGIWFRFVACAN